MLYRIEPRLVKVKYIVGPQINLTGHVCNGLFPIPLHM